MAPAHEGTASVRPVRDDELTALLDLLSDADTGPTATDDEPSLARLLDQENATIFVAETDGQLVGAILVGWDGWRGNLYRLAVRPSYRRRGIASALVHEAETWLRRLGAARVSALVLANQEGAEALWQAAGYARDQRVRRYVKPLS